MMVELDNLIEIQWQLTKQPSVSNRDDDRPSTFLSFVWPPRRQHTRKAFVRVDSHTR